MASKHARLSTGYVAKQPAPPGSRRGERGAGARWPSALVQAMEQPPRHARRRNPSAQLHERGSYAPLRMGGDTRSQRVEAHADLLLGLHRREPDLTLHEICDRLSRARGEKVSPSMIWRFFDRHDITFKKNPRTRASRTARTSLSGGGDGSPVNSTSIR